MGAKYIWKPDSNPPVGAYEVDSNATRSRVQAVLIREDFIKEKRRPEATPDPGQYDRHLTQFATGLNKVDMGAKYTWKPDSNPPVGAYNPDIADKWTKSKMQDVLIKEETSPYRRPTEYTPDPGQYDDGMNTKFG
jgi:hypothetical protein